MDPTTATVLVQLALLAMACIAAVFSALSARRAASFDLIRDFDALAVAVSKMQQQLRSVHMSRVRSAALVPREGEGPAQQTGPMTHDQLRALLRARRNGGVQ